ncbi:MAG: hypothetical protein Ta2E_08400 [Mycoplasmoidaceae bacterium]|nr:MAG: hypothetical protein Ta2E_08400 [Mycoplasmoidaceae bacterium]
MSKSNTVKVTKDQNEIPSWFKTYSKEQEKIVKEQAKTNEAINKKIQSIIVRQDRILAQQEEINVKQGKSNKRFIDRIENVENRVDGLVNRNNLKDKNNVADEEE